MASAGHALSGFLALLWAGMTLGIVHDAAAKFSTPGVARPQLLRVGMHLFRSFRKVETPLVCAGAAIQVHNALRGSRAGCELNRPLIAASVLSAVDSHVFPMPQLLRHGDRVIEETEAHGEFHKTPNQWWVRPAHAAEAAASVAKIALLVWSAHLSFQRAYGG